MAAMAAGRAPDQARQRLHAAGWLPLEDLLPGNDTAGGVSVAGAVARVRRDPGWTSAPPPAVRFPADDHAWPSLNRLALHEDLLSAATNLLADDDATDADVRLVAACLRPAAAATDPAVAPSDEPLAGAAGLVGGKGGPHALEFVLDFANVGNSTVQLIRKDPPPPAAAAAGTRMHISFRRARDSYLHADGFTGSLAGASTLIADLSPGQRAALGFPAPGHPHWQRANIRQLCRRFPGFDPAPYLAALPPSANNRAAAEPFYVDENNPEEEEEEEEEEEGPAVDFMSEAERLDCLDVPPWRHQEGIGAPGDVRSSRWIPPAQAQPEQVQAETAGMVATAAQIQQWREAGWLLIDGVLPQDVIAEARDAASYLFPDRLGPEEGVYSEAMAEAGYHSAGPTEAR
jgi:hypothetical protein